MCSGEAGKRPTGAARAWDPMPLARAILHDHEAPPMLFLAAWKCLYRGDAEALTDLALRASRAPEAVGRGAQP